MKKNFSINLVYAFISVLIFKEIVFSTSFFEINPVINKLIDFIAYGVFILHIFKRLKLPRNEMILLILLGLITFVSSILIFNFTLFTSYLIYVLSIIEGKNKIIKTIFYSSLISIIFVIIIYAYNYNIGTIAKVHEHNGRSRHFFGYTSPNIISYYAIWTFLSYYYLNFYNKKNIFFATIPIIVLYKFTQSNTMLFILCVSLIFLIFKWEKMINYLCKNGLLIILIFLFTSIILYYKDNNIGIQINNFFNQRIYYSLKAIKTFGISIIGLNNINYTQSNIIVDVTYINLLCKFGLLYILILFFICNRISKKNIYIDKILIIIWMIFALSETAALNFLICFAPILDAKNFYKGGYKNE